MEASVAGQPCGSRWSGFVQQPDGILVEAIQKSGGLGLDTVLGLLVLTLTLVKA